MNLKESIRKVLKEETEDFITCLPLFRDFKLPDDNVKIRDEKWYATNMDKFFWQVIDFVDYPLDNDYKRIRNIFLNLHRYCGIDSDVFLALKTCFYSKIEALEKKWGDDIYNVGDDSWGDLRSEIVSRGEDFYNRAMYDFDMVQRMANNEDYTESFQYAFPYHNELS